MVKVTHSELDRVIMPLALINNQWQIRQRVNQRRAIVPFLQATGSSYLNSVSWGKRIKACGAKSVCLKCIICYTSSIFRYMPEKCIANPFSFCLWESTLILSAWIPFMAKKLQFCLMTPRNLFLKLQGLWTYIMVNSCLVCVCFSASSGTLLGPLPWSPLRRKWWP